MLKSSPAANLDINDMIQPVNTPEQLERDQLNSLISSMADGVLAVDRFTNVIVYNGAALNILDLNQSITKKPLNRVLQLIDKNNQPVDAIAYVRNITIPTTDETLKLLYSDGSSINLFFSVSPVVQTYGAEQQKGNKNGIKNIKGNNGYVIVLRDITREKSLEEERDEFISVVSHELRTPIAIAEGNISNAQFVADKAAGSAVVTTPAKDRISSEQIRQALHDAHEQILFLAAMINDLSTLSRAERGKLVAEVEQINVHDMINDLIANYQEQAAKKNLRLDADLDPKLELLSSSKLYVREVLQNFVTNAIKYTEQGSVTLSARPHTANMGNINNTGNSNDTSNLISNSASSGVLFSIIDTGIGISHGDQEKIFDKFFRSEDYRTRQHNGTGLGLYITMKLARILHAEIDVSSQLDHGSTFTVFVPNLT